MHRRGHRLGLVSDCSAEVPALWPETTLAPYFGSAIFSCIMGVKKPDPRMYLTACEQLNVAPQQCLYVGDGNSNELSGASNLGIAAILLCMPTEAGFQSPTNESKTWQGARIESLNELLLTPQLQSNAH